MKEKVKNKLGENIEHTVPVNKFSLKNQTKHKQTNSFRAANPEIKLTGFNFCVPGLFFRWSSIKWIEQNQSQLLALFYEHWQTAVCFFFQWQNQIRI